MEFTKDMFDKHPLHDEYKQKFKLFHTLNIIVRTVLFFLSLLFFFLIPMDKVGYTPFQLLKNLLDGVNFYSPLIIFFTLIPLSFCLTNIVTLLLLFFKKIDYLPLFATSRNFTLYFTTIMRVALPIVGIILVANLAEKTLLFNFGCWAALYIILAFTSAFSYFSYTFIAKKYVLTVANQLDNNEKKYKDIDKSFKKVAVYYGAHNALLNLHTGLGIFAFYIFLIMYSILSPLTYSFGHSYSFPNELGDHYYETGIPLTQEFIDKTYLAKGEGEIVVHSSNYEYYKDRIELLEKEILKTKEDFSKIPILSITQSDLKQYEEKIATLNDEIYSCEKSMRGIEYQTIYLRLKYKDVGFNQFTFIITEMYLDANNTIKDKEVKNISLSQTNFTMGTNFNSQNISATVEYKDGSKKMYYITVENAYELKTAQKGKHTLKWSDSLGSYEHIINIV